MKDNYSTVNNMNQLIETFVQSFANENSEYSKLEICSYYISGDTFWIEWKIEFEEPIRESFDLLLLFAFVWANKKD